MPVMRGSDLPKLIPTGVLALLAACGGDQVVQPRQTLRAPADAPPSADVYVKRIYQNADSTKTMADFTVTPSGGWFVLGRNAIYFPPNSICDPRKSTYGPTEWDKPCPTLTAPIDIHAEMRNDLNDTQWIDFSPSLRFAPAPKKGKQTDRYVYLYMYSPKAVNADGESEQQFALEMEQRYALLWTPALGVPGVDESVTDKTLKTHVYDTYGILYRRIKHFTGYQVGAGFYATDSDDSGW
jgi:hypothetical protein